MHCAPTPTIPKTLEFLGFKISVAIAVVTAVLKEVTKIPSIKQTGEPVDASKINILAITDGKPLIGFNG